MSKMRKFLGGDSRLILAMTMSKPWEDPYTKITRDIRVWAAKSLRARPDDWYAIERNKYSPWGRGKFGGRQYDKHQLLPVLRPIDSNRVVPTNREYA